MDDKHLTVGRTCAYAYDGDGEFLTHTLAEGGGNLLQHQGKTSGVLQGMGIGNEFLRLGILLGTDGICTVLVDALWHEAEVTHHGDTGIQDGFDGVNYLHSSLQFEGIGMGFLHDAYGIGNTLGAAHLI